MGRGADEILYGAHGSRQADWAAGKLTPGLRARTSALIGEIAAGEVRTALLVLRSNRDLSRSPGQAPALDRLYRALASHEVKSSYAEALPKASRRFGAAEVRAERRHLTDQAEGLLRIRIASEHETEVILPLRLMDLAYSSPADPGPLLRSRLGEINEDPGLDPFTSGERLRLLVFGQGESPGQRALFEALLGRVAEAAQYPARSLYDRGGVGAKSRFSRRVAYLRRGADTDRTQHPTLLHVFEQGELTTGCGQSPYTLRWLPRGAWVVSSRPYKRCRSCERALRRGELTALGRDESETRYPLLGTAGERELRELLREPLRAALRDAKWKVTRGGGAEPVDRRQSLEVLASDLIGDELTGIVSRDLLSNHSDRLPLLLSATRLDLGTNPKWPGIRDTLDWEPVVGKALEPDGLDKARKIADGLARQADARLRADQRAVALS